MNKRKLAVRGLTAVVVIALLGLFAYANSGQYVDLRFGLVNLRSVSLPLVIYGAVVVGMLMMLGVGLRNDLRARSESRQLSGGPPPGKEVAQEKILKEVKRQAR